MCTKVAQKCLRHMFQRAQVLGVHLKSPALEFCKQCNAFACWRFRAHACNFFRI